MTSNTPATPDSMKALAERLNFAANVTINLLHERLFREAAKTLSDLQSQLQAERARADGALEWASVHERRVNFVRDTLTDLMERHGGPTSRRAEIHLSGSTIAEWLITLAVGLSNDRPASGEEWADG